MTAHNQNFSSEKNIRYAAVTVLGQILDEDRMSHLAIRDCLEQNEGWEPNEKAFFQRLVEETLEHLIPIDYLLDHYSKTPVRKMKPYVRNVLRASVCQILYFDSVPDAAACNEGVSLIIRRKMMGLKGFVNGVLRTVVREKENLPWPDEKENEELALSVRYSLPVWLVRHLLNDRTKEECERIAAAFQEESPLTVRINKSRISKEEVCRRLKEEGVAFGEGILVDAALRLQDGTRPDTLKEFQEGYLQVQDESSMLAVLSAGIRPGMKVLDVCAAPGGKSLHAADLTGEGGEVSSRDVSEEKVSKIIENAKRSGFTQIHAKVHDARVPDPEWTGKADVVIADVPCSGLGIIRRKNDIRYKANPEKLSSLVLLQREILDACQAYVKPGGILLFSTCTINREENEANREYLLAHYPFEPVDLTENHALSKVSEREKTLQHGYLQLLPGLDPCDGFFFAVLRRK